MPTAALLSWPSVADGFVEIGVTDGDQRQPEPSVVKDDLKGAGGRGLAIVTGFSDEWGTAVLPEGKEVWFRLSTADWSYSPACRCLSEDPGKSGLASGRQVLAISGSWDDLQFRKQLAV
jgi:hypothetical protein